MGDTNRQKNPKTLLPSGLSDLWGLEIVGQTDRQYRQWWKTCSYVWKIKSRNFAVNFALQASSWTRAECILTDGFFSPWERRRENVSHETSTLEGVRGLQMFHMKHSYCKKNTNETTLSFALSLARVRVNCSILLCDKQKMNVSHETLWRVGISSGQICVNFAHFSCKTA